MSRGKPKKSEIAGWRDDLLSENEKQGIIKQIVGDENFNEISKKADDADAMFTSMNEKEQYRRQIERKNNEKLKLCKLDKEDKRYLKEIFRRESLPKSFIAEVELCIKDYIHKKAQEKPPTKKQTTIQLEQLAKLAGKIDNDIKGLKQQLQYDEKTENLVECAFIENELTKSKSGVETKLDDLLNKIEASVKDFQYPFILALDKVKTEFIPNINKPENNPRANLAFNLGRLMKIFLDIKPTSTDPCSYRDIYGDGKEHDHAPVEICRFYNFVHYILEKIKGSPIGNIQKEVIIPAIRKLKEYF